MLRPIYTGDFCCDFSGNFCCDFVVISNRPCKLLVIPRQFESPVVHMGDLKSCEIALEIAAKIATKIAAKIASVNGPLVLIL